MSHYDVLGVAPDADGAEVRRAYLALARRHHPDRRGGDADRMRAVNEAWAVLGDPGRRHRYDLSLGGAAATAPPWTAGASGGPDAPDIDLDWDDRPLGAAVPASGWFALVPVGLFAASVAIGVLGLLLQLPGLMGASFLLFALSCLAFMAAPLLSLYASRRGTGPSGARPPR